MGLALSVVFALVAFFGAKIYKRASKYSLIIKWASGGFLILFGLISAVMFGKQNMAS
jgi:amino acid transporter